MCTSAAAGCLFSLVHCLHCTTPAPKKASGRTRKSRFAFFWIFPSLPPSLFPSVSPHPAFPGHGKTACIRKIFCRLRSDRGGATESAYLMKRLTTDFGRTGDKIASRAENPDPPLSLPCTPPSSCMRPHFCSSAFPQTPQELFRGKSAPSFPSAPRPAVFMPANATNDGLFPEHYSRYFWLSAAFSAKKRRKRGGMKKFPDAICLLFARFVV